jgi:hypothetical protein
VQCNFNCRLRNVILTVNEYILMFLHSYAATALESIVTPPPDCLININCSKDNLDKSF